jgi:hypothetical protein
VVLPAQLHDLSEWLADGAAFDAAGADALWVDLGPEPDLDPLTVTAALAAITFRSLLVTAAPASYGPAEARVLVTVGRLSHGRLRIVTDASAPAGFTPGLAAFRRIPGDPEAVEHLRGPHEVEHWVQVPAPDSRAAWRATLLDAAERDLRGVLVPAGPRLLDMLRHPEDDGFRHDLQLAQG